MQRTQSSSPDDLRQSVQQQENSLLEYIDTMEPLESFADVESEAYVRSPRLKIFFRRVTKSNNNKRESW